MAGGTGSVAVTAGNGCVWTAVSNAAWIHAAAAGNGNGEVLYSVDANPSPSARTGTATIAGQTFSVDQQGTAPCTYAVSPIRPKFSEFARSGTVAVTAAAGCGWSAASNAAWITIDSGASGSGNGAVNYSVGSLPGRLTQRSGTLTVAGKTVTVVQSR